MGILGLDLVSWFPVSADSWKFPIGSLGPQGFVSTVQKEESGGAHRAKIHHDVQFLLLGLHLKEDSKPLLGTEFTKTVWSPGEARDVSWFPGVAIQWAFPARGRQGGSAGLASLPTGQGHTIPL